MKSTHLPVVALLLTANLCHAGDYCAYADTNRLSLDKTFQKSIQDFFGKQKASYYRANGDLASQTMEGLGGPPDSLAHLDGNLVLVSACRAHSCDEEAAVILQCPSQILAVGMIHFDCAVQPVPEHCSSNAVLTLFFDDKNRTYIGRAALEDWGRNKADENHETIRYEYRSQHGKLLSNPVPGKPGN